MNLGPIPPRMVLEVVNAARAHYPEKDISMIVDVVRSSGDDSLVYVVYSDNTILPLRDDPSRATPMAEPCAEGGVGAVFNRD